MAIDENKQICKRFFLAFNRLIEIGKIDSAYSFSNKYGIDRRNFQRTYKDHDTHTIKLGWLSILVRDYEVSSEWLLTGKGQMFRHAKTSDGSANRFWYSTPSA